jgi:hypothetical protein
VSTGMRWHGVVARWLDYSDGTMSCGCCGRGGATAVADAGARHGGMERARMAWLRLRAGARGGGGMAARRGGGVEISASTGGGGSIETKRERTRSERTVKRGEIRSLCDDRTRWSHDRTRWRQRPVTVQ